MLPQAEKGWIKMDFLDMEKNLDGREQELEEITEQSDQFLWELNGGQDSNKMEDFVEAFENKTPNLQNPREAFYRILEEANKSMGTVKLASIKDPVTGLDIQTCWFQQSSNRLKMGISIGTVVQSYDEEIKEAQKKLLKLLVENEVITHGLRGVNL
jgi:hypothetical protein